jgi:hypothetical protein
LRLERGTLRVAVEISVTTGVTHEVGNLLKCLNGNFTHIAFITADQRKARQIAENLRERVSPTDAARVGFYDVESFAQHLRGLPLEPAVSETSVSETPTPPKKTQRVVKGWKVITKASEQTSAEAKEKEEEGFRALGEALRPRPSA